MTGANTWHPKRVGFPLCVCADVITSAQTLKLKSNLIIKSDSVLKIYLHYPLLSSSNSTHILKNLLVFHRAGFFNRGRATYSFNLIFFKSAQKQLFLLQ